MGQKPWSVKPIATVIVTVSSTAMNTRFARQVSDRVGRNMNSHVRSDGPFLLATTFHLRARRLGRRHHRGSPDHGVHPPAAGGKHYVISPR
jgi:hypothetical protein